MTVKSAQRAMTPLAKVFMVSSEAPLDGPTRDAILGSGHSRIPVYRGPNK
jgi:metal transporter CNNM